MGRRRRRERERGEKMERQERARGGSGGWRAYRYNESRSSSLIELETTQEAVRIPQPELPRLSLHETDMCRSMSETSFTPSLSRGAADRPALLWMISDCSVHRVVLLLCTHVPSMTAVACSSTPAKHPYRQVEARLLLGG